MGKEGKKVVNNNGVEGKTAAVSEEDDVIEFRLRISKGELRKLRENSYLVEENNDATDEEVLVDMMGVHFIKDCRFGETYELETLEIIK